ncbi:hypothetical protein AB0F18_20385 [Streptomyces sp. NPDC029216]|uniref:hypothetical protein n=1 Tax=Streptomyces sp. NPDC029216 TaxID=3154701 RepID=UPI0033C0FBCD
MYEITYLDAGTEPATHTAGADEIGDLVAWAGRHGVKVRVRPYTGPGSGHVAGGAGDGGERL